MPEHSSPDVEPKRRSREEYTVGWVCALPKELTAAVAMLDVEHPSIETPATDPNSYILGSIGEHNVVIASLPKGMIGTNSAAAVAVQMVNTFSNIKFGLMVGIGGGIPPKVRLGDVVVGTPVDAYPGVVQWDFGKATDSGFQRTGALNNPPRSLLSALAVVETKHALGIFKIPQYLEELKEKHPSLASKFLKSESLKDVAFKASARHISKSIAIAEGLVELDEDEEEEEDEEEDACRFCDKTKTFKGNDKGTVVHMGLIASGNQVIKDVQVRKQISKELGGNVLCLEMEAAGLANIFPCLVIRGICDYADAHKNKDWQEHAAAVAAAFAKELLGYVQGAQVNQEQPAKDILQKIDGAVSRIEAHVKYVQSNMEKETDNEILDWLTTTDYGPIQSDTLRKIQAGAGEWFLESEQFQEWHQNDMRILFCQDWRLGNDDTLKIMTAAVIDRLLTSYKNNNRVGIAYLYLGCESLDKRKVEDLFASLLKQLTQGLSSVPDCVKDLYEYNRKSGTQPKLEEYSQTLLLVVGAYSKVFIIVNALEECGPRYRPRPRFLTEISDFQSKSCANLFVTCKSTFYSNMHAEFRNYTEESSTRAPMTTDGSASLWVDNKLADPMFSLVKFRLAPLRSIDWEEEVWTALGDGLESGIQSQTTLERDPEFDVVNVPDLGGLIQFSCGLVTANEESGLIRLIHYVYPDGKDQWGRTPLLMAAEAGQEAVVKILMEKGASLESQNGRGQTPLSIAAEAGREAVVKILMDKGANLETKEERGQTPLSLAAEGGHESVVRMLVEKGASLATGDKWGQSPLLLATARGHEAVVKVLMENGANINAADQYGRTPLQLAIGRGHDTVAKLLKSKKDTGKRDWWRR
ncbi:hypothetical protein TWF281_003843 [Arthrobotrys megalospora]